VACGDQLFASDVATVLADGRQHGAGGPVLKAAGLGVGALRSHDDLVQAGFKDHVRVRAIPYELLSPVFSVER